MKATGIVRRIDDLGRVVIPKEIRRTLRIREGAPYAELETKPRRRPPLGKRRFSPAALRFRSGSVPQMPAQAFCAGIIVRFDKITVLCGTSFCIIS